MQLRMMKLCRKAEFAHLSALESNFYELCCCACCAFFSQRINQTRIYIHLSLQDTPQPSKNIRALSQSGSNVLSSYDLKFVSNHYPAAN